MTASCEPLELANVCATGDFVVRQDSSDDLLGGDDDETVILTLPKVLPTVAKHHPFMDLVNDMKENSRLPSLGQQLPDMKTLSLTDGRSEENDRVMKCTLFTRELFLDRPFSATSSISSIDRDSNNVYWRNHKVRSLTLDLDRVSSVGGSSKERQEFVSKAISCELAPHQSLAEQSGVGDGLESKYSKMERTLVLDLLHIFQGCSGTVLRFSDGNLFTFQTEEKYLHPAHKTLALRLCPIGVCYKMIKAQLAAPNRGKCFEALKTWFQDQLQEFDLMVLALERLMQGNGMDEELLQKYRKIIPQGVDTITLHQLECLFFDAKKILKAMTSMLSQIQPFTVGGQLCSVLYDFTHHGDPDIQEFAYRTVAVVSRPLYKMIGTWIFHGYFPDKHEEFFISVDQKCPTETMWRGKFTLKKDFVPNFITMAEANLIFRAGKNLNFLVDVCKSSDVFSDKARLFQLYKNIDIETTLRDADSTFTELVRTAFRVTSEQVLKQIVTHEKLFEHLHTIKYYILQGQGDFFQLFLIRTRDVLMKPARFMNMQEMQETLQLTLTGATHVPSTEFLSRISVSRVPVSDTLRIWDVFCLEYNASECLRQILTRESMFVYSRVFAFLWESLRVETVVKTMWMDRKMFDKKLIQVVPEIRKIVFMSNVLITEYNNFIVQVRYYVMSEAVETEWQKLMDTLTQMKCLEDLIGAHEEFLKVINIRCLQSRAANGVLRLLESIYSQIFKMEKFYGEFCNRASREYNRRLNPTPGTIPEVNEFMLRDFRKYLEETEELIGNLQVTSRDFIQSFLLAAENYIDDVHKNINLNGFCYRVDFNNFYTDRNPELREAKTAKNCLPEFGGGRIMDSIIEEYTVDRKPKELSSLPSSPVGINSMDNF